MHLKDSYKLFINKGMKYVIEDFFIRKKVLISSIFLTRKGVGEVVQGIGMVATKVYD